MHTIVILIIDDVRPYPYECFAYQLGSYRSGSRWRCFLSLPWLVRVWSLQARITGTISRDWRLDSQWSNRTVLRLEIMKKTLGNRTRARWHESALFLALPEKNCTAPHILSWGELELFEVKLGGWPVVIAQFTTSAREINAHWWMARYFLISDYCLFAVTFMRYDISDEQQLINS